MNRPWLLFLHGINANDDDPWRVPLNDAITRFGYEPFPSERVLTPDYRAALRGEATGAQAARTTWKRPPKDEWRRAKTEYLARMASLETRIRPLSNAIPDWVQPPGLANVPAVGPLVDDARRYARSADVRAAVHELVLQSLEAVPEGSRIVILAHSLGSVIAADLIKKLPGNLRFSALVTIGSPLGSISEFRSRDLDDYPCDRLSAWVNLFEPRDPVTGGRGIGGHYPWAIDVPVTLQDWVFPVLIHQHGAAYYCSHGAVAAAITGALLGADLATLGAEPAPGVKGLELLLLQSLHLRELAKRLPTDDLDRLARLERARQVTAASHVSAAALVHERNPATAPLPASEFLQRPDAHIRGAWDDRTVLALAIMLASGPPAPPFKIEEASDTEERRLALVSTLSLIREHRSQITDVDIVDAIFSTRPTIIDLLAPGRSWVPAALLAAGVIMLAATGVGLAVAAPAGLVGAAVITSTLAAFGPGGMVGGMATLAALAGAGSAMAAAGAALGASGVPRITPDLLATALDGAIASADPETLRSLLISLLTLVAAQERLTLPTQRDQMLLACTNAQAQQSLRVAAHESIDPKSDAAKAARDKLALLEKACRWLRGEEKPDSVDAREWSQISTAYSQAVNGRLDPLMKVLAGPGRGRPEQPALEGPKQ